MNVNEVWQLFDPLFDDDEIIAFPDQKPLLAHYTSIEVLEKILSSEQLWLSNPLNMNDYNELRLGVILGAQIVRQSAHIRDALGSDESYENFLKAFEYRYRYFEDNEVLDTYVFCFSEHTSADSDGLLSMWRGYGGNGKGVAIVFDMEEIEPVSASPIIVAKVKYESNEGLRLKIEFMVDQFAKILNQNSVPDDMIKYAVERLFDAIRLLSLLIKHDGFHEEKEWRIVYFADWDRENKLSENFDYHHGPTGIEPKLRLPISGIEGIIDEDISLERIIHSILIGPAGSSILSEMSTKRMIENLGYENLVKCVESSKIPYRST